METANASGVFPGLPGSIVLASGSPRRRELLGLLGVEFEVVAADVDETPLLGESSIALVERLAVAKAAAVAKRLPSALVVGADTVVEVDGTTLGKPLDPDDARRMLRSLSARSHHVHTGVAVVRGEEVLDAFTIATAVTMLALSDDVIDWYVATGEPADKAGAYAIQGLGATLVQGVVGSVTNVVGLPIAELAGRLVALQTNR